MPREFFKVGLNRSFVGKPAKSDGINFATDWHPSEITQAELIEHVGQGHAFTAHYKNARRKTMNFICSDFIAADIDCGVTLEEALALPFVQQHASFIYTTPSHTETEHRFRIVFLLEDTITIADDWANALLGLAIKLRSDRAIKDAGRMFYGSTTARVFDLGKLLPADEVMNLISVGMAERARKGDKWVSSYALTAAQRINPRLVVAMEAGVPIPLEEAKQGTSVHCPFHEDKRASAHIVRSLRGTNGIHCMACDRTFWPEDAVPYDFNSFGRLVQEKIFQDKERAEAQKHHPNILERYFPPEPQVQVIQTKYLSKLDYRPGITLVKSPKGSGKTKAIAALVDQIRRGLFLHGTAKDDKPKSVLLIGHRRSLIREAANRLGLDCYLDDDADGTHRKKRFGYAICLDSLPKITGGSARPGRSARTDTLPLPQYDVVILDESEQIIGHLLSETLRSGVGLVGAFASLEFVLRRAKAVYALDADLGLITAHAMQDLRADDWKDNCRIILNKPLPVSERREMQIYQSKKDLQDRMLDAIRAGKRVFVASNSKEMVKAFAELIGKEFGTSLEMMAITSDNSQGDEESFFVQNIQTEFLKKQVLLCSPSLGTGIDISFPDGRCEVDEVIGFFSPFVNTHADIDQQLSRVRNPGAVSVWFEGAKLDFETSFDVIRRQLAASNYVPTARIGTRLNDDGNATYDFEDPLLKIAAHVKVAERSSKRDIVRLFVTLREENGWDVRRIEKPEKPAKNEKLAEAVRNVNEKRILAILNARNINDEEFEELSQRMQTRKPVSWDDRNAMERYRLAKTYGRQVDRALIVRDKKGQLRDQCQEYRRIFHDGTFKRFGFPTIKEELDAGKAIQDNPLWWLVATVMIAVGLIVDGELKRNAVVRSDRLGSFVTLCANNRFLIEEKLGKPLRDDLEDKPVTTLNEFLSKVGIKVVPTGRKVRKGSSANEYRIDLAALNLIEEIALSNREILQQNPR